MNILEPIWTKIFIKNTYACIKGRGIHSLLKDLKYDISHDSDNTKYCLKLDIKKFYPQINHEILKTIIRKKIKDIKLLNLLDNIIDSAPGVPIGNYLSQYFANLYLAYFDHWVKEELRVKYYYRYADDIVILSKDKNQLRQWLIVIKLYLSQVLKLQLKSNYQIFLVDSRGIDYVGYVIKHDYIRLRKSIKKRMLKTINLYIKNKISDNVLKIKMESYFGWIKYCNSKNLLIAILNKTGIWNTGWNGIKTNITYFKNKKIYVINIFLRNKYFIVQFIYNRKSYEFKSTNKNLFLRLYSYEKLPQLITL